jgi:AcrR family transcriptional regulator
MVVKRRQAEHSAQTRTALVRVARRLFAQHGYAATATEEVVRRARVTRGALYHHFKDKQDLFKAVYNEEQLKLAERTSAAAAAAPDPWSAMVAGANAMLDACLEPAVHRIVMIDAPAVLGMEKWRESDQSYYLAAMKVAVQAAIDQGQIERQPVDPLAHLILGALTEAAMLIARADDKAAARREVSAAMTRMFDGLRAKQ